MRGDPNACGHIIQASGGSGANRKTINFTTERVVGNGSFGVVFQATCLETGETVSRVQQAPWGDADGPTYVPKKLSTVWNFIKSPVHV